MTLYDLDCSLVCSSCRNCVLGMTERWKTYELKMFRWERKFQSFEVQFAHNRSGRASEAWRPRLGIRTVSFSAARKQAQDWILGAIPVIWLPCDRRKSISRKQSAF